MNLIARLDNAMVEAIANTDGGDCLSERETVAIAKAAREALFAQLAAEDFAVVPVSFTDSMASAYDENSGPYPVVYSKAYRALIEAAPKLADEP